MATQFQTLSSGQLVSGIFHVTDPAPIGLIFPTITSCNAFLQAALTTNSGDFVRCMKEDGSGVFTLSVGAGSIAAAFPMIAAGFPFFRIETSVAQAVTSSIGLTNRII